MTSSRETVKPGINLLVSPEEDDPDRGVAKIKLLKAAFEDPDADIPWQQKKRFDDFDYGYALTVHKAQGSQWNDIVLFDESYAFKETRQRWLYTAITARRRRRLTVGQLIRLSPLTGRWRRSIPRRLLRPPRRNA